MTKVLDAIPAADAVTTKEEDVVNEVEPAEY